MEKMPPIGIKPRKIWLESRFLELSGAINRYVNAGMGVPVEWIIEYNELLKEVYK